MMERKPVVFGAVYASYTTKLNYEQCKYRLYLMGDKEANRDLVEIFPPMHRGLVLHKAMELFFTEGRMADFDELRRFALQPSRDNVDWGSKKLVFYEPYDPDRYYHELELELKAFQKALPELELPEYKEVRCEWELERTFEGTKFQGHIDIAFKLKSGRWICADLKTGKYDPHSEQFLLYNWMANGFLRFPFPFFIFHWDGNQIRRHTVYHRLGDKEPKLMRLLWQMREINQHLSEAQQAIAEGKRPASVLRPNTKNFTCHRHRCSFFGICPYGAQRKQEAQDATDNGDME